MCYDPCFLSYEEVADSLKTVGIAKNMFKAIIKNTIKIIKKSILLT